MKIDRLEFCQCCYKKTVTAPYLAEKFEVSRRTINRDIEDLCKAGIPIVTKQGMDEVKILEQELLKRQVPMPV